jgi:ferredoxin
MSKVVVQIDNASLAEAATSCPVDCFRQQLQSCVINPDECVDCGLCQTIVKDGIILDDIQASEKDVNFNREKSLEWNRMS